MIHALKGLSGMTTEEWEEHDARIRADREREASERRRLETKRAIEAMEIPPRVLELLAGPIDRTEAVAALESAPLLVCLSGNPGCGKTVAAARWLHERGAGLFLKSPRLARWERYDDVQMRRLLDAPALVIDDLGTEFADTKGNYLALLDELLDHRYDHRLPLVATTNLDAAAFKARYGERIADRIREEGRFASIAQGSLRKRPTPAPNAS